NRSSSGDAVRNRYRGELAGWASRSRSRSGAALSAERRRSAAVAQTLRSWSNAARAWASTGGSPETGCQAARAVAGSNPYGWSPILSVGHGPRGQHVLAGPSGCLVDVLAKPVTSLSVCPHSAGQSASTTVWPQSGQGGTAGPLSGPSRSG